MEGSILNTIKEMLDVFEEDSSFDGRIRTMINSSMNLLFQLGVGPQDKPFVVRDKQTTWGEFSEDIELVEMCKSYIYLYVWLQFDPPQTSFITKSIQDQISELSWRLTVHTDEHKESDHEFTL